MKQCPKCQRMVKPARLGNSETELIWALHNTKPRNAPRCTQSREPWKGDE